MFTHAGHNAVQSPNSGADRWLFYLLLAVLVWLPLPFGNNRPDSWWITQTLILCPFIAWLLSPVRKGVRQSMRRKVNQGAHQTPALRAAHLPLALLALNAATFVVILALPHVALSMPRQTTLESG